MKRQRLIAVVCITLGALAADPSCGWAQPATLPPATVHSSDLSAHDREVISGFIDAQKGGLTASPLEIKRSRNALLDPLRDAEVSVQFRLEYSRALLPILRPLVMDKNQVIAVNSLEVCGDLATAASTEVLADALKDNRPGVRYAAGSAYEHTFMAVQRSVPALGTPQQSMKTLDALATAIQAERDPRVLEGLVLAMAQATTISKAQIEGMRDYAVSSLSKSISQKIADRKISPAADPALRRAILAIRTAVTNPNINEPELTPQTLKDAAGMAGDLLALAYERTKTGAIAQGAESDLALMVSEAERAVFFIQSKLSSGQQPQDLKLNALVQQRNFAEFQRQVMQLIGPNGVLTGPIFGFGNDRFVKGG